MKQKSKINKSKLNNFISYNKKNADKYKMQFILTFDTSDFNQTFKFYNSQIRK